MVVLALSWRLMTQAGFVDKVSKFLVKIGFADGLTISGPTLWRGATSVGAVLVLLNTIITFLLVLLYNLLSSLFGGLIVSVIEERIGDGQPRNGASNAERSAEQSTQQSTRPERATRSRRATPEATPGKLPSGLRRRKAPVARVRVPEATSVDFWSDPLDPDATMLQSAPSDSTDPG